MTKIYENVYIGTFILALGFKLGTDSPDKNPLASVNLYQQTPGDPLLGDIVASLSGVVTLLEFKKTEEDTASEFHKRLSRRWCRKIWGEMRKLSIGCHFISFGDASDSGNVDLRFGPFLGLGEYHLGRTMRTPPTVGLWAFIEGFLRGSIGVPPGDFLQYIKTIDDLTDGDGGGIGGLVLNFGEDGEVRLCAFESLRALLETSGGATGDRKAEKARPKQHVKARSVGGDDQT